MIRKIVLFFIVFLFISTSSSNVLASSKLDKLNVSVDDALQLAKIKRYEESVHILEDFSNMTLTVAAQGNDIQTSELKILTQIYKEAVAALESDRTTDEEKVRSVMKLRLVVDAIDSEYQPLWISMEENVLASVDKAHKAAVERYGVEFHQEFDQFLQYYDLIQPSLQIDVKAETMQMLEARIRYIDQYRPQVFDNVDNHQELKALKNDLEGIFENMKEDESDPSLWWVIISTGSIILLSLSYVGWRKYVGNKKSEKYKNKLKD